MRSSQRESQITATARVPLPAQVFFAAWCAMVVAIGGRGRYQSITSDFASDRSVAPIFAMVMRLLLLGSGVAYVIARSIVNQRRRPELEACLRNITGGKASLSRIE